HIPTAETEAARSSLILEGQRQARSHLKFNPSWSHEWGPVQFVQPDNEGRKISTCAFTNVLQMF
ncbi:hypothetical protein, partial [Roseiarcus sp.]|uniref:hypothetical protein n=1 Tax=Roseiarcus sp. TaxID=1969460 RepID=UPI003D14ABD3